jgi:hypothetical protein
MEPVGAIQLKQKVATPTHAQTHAHTLHSRARAHAYLHIPIHTHIHVRMHSRTHTAMHTGSPVPPLFQRAQRLNAVRGGRYARYVFYHCVAHARIHAYTR